MVSSRMLIWLSMPLKMYFLRPYPVYAIGWRRWGGQVEAEQRSVAGEQRRSLKESGTPKKWSSADVPERRRVISMARAEDQCMSVTYPRLQTVDPQTPGFFHCISRCVRRAFLCGRDVYSGRSYEHRKAWVEERLLALAECFAVGLYAYAVMSNHVHVVLHVDPQVAQAWSDEEVAERWVRLFPVRVDEAIDERLCQEKVRRLQGDPERMAELRNRLGSLSWFMRCLNEPIARQANREDGCTGRFWEGRFKCQALLDEQAVLSCMAYVDLNPIRAGIVPDLAASEHTSIHRRLQHAETGTASLNARLRPMAGTLLTPALSLRAVDYVELMDWSGRTVREEKRGAIRAEAPSILSQLGLQERQWHAQMLGTESRYWRAVGTVESLRIKARALGQRWLKGAGRERRRACG